MIYIPDEAYRIQTNGNYNSSTFTGIVVYTDVNGQAFLSYKIVNGQIERLYNATVNRRRNAISRDCLAMGFPSCQYVFDWCGNITFCDCSGNCGAGMGGVFGPTGNSSGSSGSGRGFSYGGGFSGGAGSGSGGSGGGGSGGGGGAWNSSQPGSLFTMSEIEALRIKFRNANLDDIFYTLELPQNQALLKAANLFLDTRGWDNLNKPALERLVNGTGEYQALAEYLTALCASDDFYNANVALNIPTSTFTAFAKYYKAGFTPMRFGELFVNQQLFQQVNTYLNGKNFVSKAAWDARFHTNLYLTDSEYALFNQSEGFPTDLDNLASAFSYPFDNCWCKTVSYTVTNGRLVITSNYNEGGDFFGVATCCRAAIIPTDHPDKAYLSQVLMDIERIKKKPEAAEPVLEWVYEIQGLGVPPVLTCKSCNPIAYITLNSGETYKFGTTKNEGGFQASIEGNNGRYPDWVRPIYGFFEFNFVGVIRPNANVLAIQRVNEPIPKNDARLLEKILIFNYILSNTQQPTLRARGIRTNHDLPPGNSIAR